MGLRKDGCQSLLRLKSALELLSDVLPTVLAAVEDEIVATQDPNAATENGEVVPIIAPTIAGAAGGKILFETEFDKAMSVDHKPVERDADVVGGLATLFEEARIGKYLPIAQVLLHSLRKHWTCNPLNVILEETLDLQPLERHRLRSAIERHRLRSTIAAYRAKRALHPQPLHSGAAQLASASILALNDYGEAAGIEGIAATTSARARAASMSAGRSADNLSTSATVIDEPSSASTDHYADSLASMQSRSVTDNGRTKFWKVVGGLDKGGILVRTSQDHSASQATERLSTGAIVQELSLTDKKLHYKRLTGSGPDEGWVITSLKSGKSLLVQTGAAGTQLEGLEPPPVSRRKLRVLGVHGKGSNSNIMKFQTTKLRKLLEKDAEWLFIDATLPWFPKAPGLALADDEHERSDFENRLANGKPFVEWFRIEDHGGPHERWINVDKSYAHIKRFLVEEAPIDVVVAFSVGSTFISVVIEELRREGNSVPWQLSVFFLGGYTFAKGMVPHLFPAPSQQPTILVTSDALDIDVRRNQLVMENYTDLLALKHDDGHFFPRTSPRADEIYAKVADEMRRRCGLSLL